jgi:hypothetical protein
VRSCKSFVLFFVKRFVQMFVFYLIFFMTRKRLSHPNNSYYLRGELSMSQGRNFTPLVRKCYELFLDVEWVTKVKVGLLIFVV